MRSDSISSAAVGVVLNVLIIAFIVKFGGLGWTDFASLCQTRAP
jgi:hypothetical protein